MSREAAGVEGRATSPGASAQRVGRPGSDPHQSSRGPQGFEQRHDRIGFTFNTCHGLCMWRRSGLEGSRLEEGRPGGGPCRSLWCVNVFQKLLEREARPLETVHFRAKPWKDIKQLSVSLSLIPDGDTRVPCTLALRMSVHI